MLQALCGDPTLGSRRLLCADHADAAVNGAVNAAVEWTLDGRWMDVAWTSSGKGKGDGKMDGWVESGGVMENRVSIFNAVLSAKKKILAVTALPQT